MSATRIAALTLIASGSLLLLLDIIENLLEPSWDGMAAGYLWSMIWPTGLSGARAFVEGHISVMLWQRILLPLLMLPLWALMFVAGGILFFTGRSDDSTP